MTTTRVPLAIFPAALPLTSLLDGFAELQTGFFVWQLMALLWQNRGLVRVTRCSVKPGLSEILNPRMYICLQSDGNVSYFCLWIQRTMKHPANPFISLYTLSTGFRRRTLPKRRIWAKEKVGEGLFWKKTSRAGMRGYKVTSRACRPSGHTYGGHSDGTRHARYMGHITQSLFVNNIIRSDSIAEWDLWTRRFGWWWHDRKRNQRQTWCFSGWLECSGTPFVFILTVDSGSHQTTILPALTSVCPVSFFPSLLSFNLATRWGEFTQRGEICQVRTCRYWLWNQRRKNCLIWLLLLSSVSQHKEYKQVHILESILTVAVSNTTLHWLGHVRSSYGLFLKVQVHAVPKYHKGNNGREELSKSSDCDNIFLPLKAN